MQEPRRKPSPVPWWGKALITALILLGGGVLMISNLPKAPFPTDLTQIGQGLPAAVVVRDVAFVTGHEVMERINRIRPEFEDRILFLAAPQGHPEGRAFANRLGVRDGDVVLFAADGQLITVLRTPGSEALILRGLNEAFPN